MAISFCSIRALIWFLVIFMPSLMMVNSQGQGNVIMQKKVHSRLLLRELVAGYDKLGTMSYQLEDAETTRPPGPDPQHHV